MLSFKHCLLARKRESEASGETMGNPTIIQGAEIRAQEVSIGEGVVLDDGISISGFHGEPAERVVIGDHTYIGPDVNIACPVLIIGNFVTIHRRTGIFGEGPCAIGHNSWIGQDCILNSHGDLWIGNNVGIGAANHIWTHAAQGELLEGCQLFYARPVIIENDAWICGGHSTVNPGVTVASKTVLLPQSLLTRSTTPNSCYGGNPAKVIDKLGTPYRELTVQEKARMLESFLAEFFLSNPHLSYSMTEGRICLFENHGSQKVGEFDWVNKTYEKKRTPEEIAFIKFMKGFRARFVPEDSPLIAGEILKKAKRKMRRDTGRRIPI
jgi:acetyltransferase-like isoleucine patch superfamily enzyme